jgi:hypothetical protein
MFSGLRTVLNRTALVGATGLIATLPLTSIASNLGVDLGHIYNPTREIASVKQRYDKNNPNQPKPAEIFPTMDVESHPLPGYPIKKAEDTLAAKPVDTKRLPASVTRETPRTPAIQPVAYPDIIGADSIR